VDDPAPIGYCPRMPTSDEVLLQQKAQWSAAASGWERWDDWLQDTMRDLTDWLCRAAKLGAGQQVLDVACGSGHPAATAAALVQPGGRVTAVDLSPDMVAITQRKARRLGLDNLDAREMNAQALAFPDGSFDGATSRFGLMLCPDPVRAMSEVRRVLRPGGRFALAVWDIPAKNPFFTSMAAIVSQFVPMPPPDPTSPGVFRLAPPGELERVLRAAGFSDVVVESRPMKMWYESREAYWQIQTDLAAPLKGALTALAPAEVARLKSTLFDALGPFIEGQGVRIGATALCAAAAK
jgi:ubiquinone/menaquinone biosynthesis C-methylase UbiE